MPSQGVIKARGLNTAENPLDLGEGWLRVAKNIAIDREGIIRMRNSIQYRDTGLGPMSFGTGAIFHRLISVNGRVWGIGDNDDGTHVITDGDQLEFLEGHPAAGYKLASGIYGNDLFLCDNVGVTKISQLVGHSPVGLPGGDENVFETEIGSDAPPVFDTGESAAYRVVFGYTDGLGHTLLGVPGGRVKFTAENDNVNCQLRISLPSSLSQYLRPFVRVYRSTIVDTGEPSDYMYLASEKSISSSDISTGYIDILDETPDDFLGVALYTNDDQEGALNANHRPPICMDMAEFSDCMFYANTRQRTDMQISILSAARIGDSITVDGEEYTFWSPDELASPSDSHVVPLWFRHATSGIFGSGGQPLDLRTHTPSQAIESAAVWLCRTINATHPRVQAQYISGANDIPGKILLTSITPGYQFSVYDSGKKSIELNHADLSGSTFTSIARAGNVTTVTLNGFGFFFHTNSGLVVGDTITVVSGNANFTSGTKTIIAVGDQSFSYSDTGPDVSTINSPDISFTFDRDSTQNYQPEMPTASSFLISNTENKPGRVYFSKKGLPDAVPLFNYLDIGNSDLPIYRVIRMRDSLVVVKEDGVYRIIGDDPTNFTEYALDTTIRISAPWTVRALSNRVFALSNIGVVAIAETGVSIISKDIDNLVDGWLGDGADGFNSYSSEARREYGIIPDSGDSIYIYSLDSNSWVEWSLASGNILTGVEGDGLGHEFDFLVSVDGETFRTYTREDLYGQDNIDGSTSVIQPQFEHVFTGGNPFSMKLFQQIQLIYSASIDTSGGGSPIGENGGVVLGTATMTASSIGHGTSRTDSYNFSFGGGNTVIGTARFGVRGAVARSNFLSVLFKFTNDTIDSLSIYGVKVDASESEKVVGSTNE